MLRRSASTTQRKRTAVRVAVSTCLALLPVAMLCISAFGVHSPARSGRRARAVVVQVPMRVDCVSMSQKARVYAVAHGYCPGVMSKSGVTLTDDVTGNCGQSWIVMYPYGNGEVGFTYGFQSSQGIADARALNVHWYNWQSGGSGQIPDSSVMWDDLYNDIAERNTGPGFVTATMYGSITLWWGGVCELLAPSDGITVP